MSRPGSRNSPANPRKDISHLPDRFFCFYMDSGAHKGAYEVRERRDGRVLLTLDDSAFAVLETDTSVPPANNVDTPTEFRCDRVVKSSDGTKQVQDYVGVYKVNRRDYRFRLADLVYFSYSDGEQPSSAYLPPSP